MKADIEEKSNIEENRIEVKRRTERMTQRYENKVKQQGQQ